jgi:hypothetical protein
VLRAQGDSVRSFDASARLATAPAVRGAAIKAVQEAGVKLVQCEAARPLVILTNGAESPTLRHFAAMIEAADAATRRAARLGDHETAIIGRSFLAKLMGPAGERLLKQAQAEAKAAGLDGLARQLGG